MTSAEILAALAEYDHEIEWVSEYDDGQTPFVHEGDRVQWEIHDDYIKRIEGCYVQEADYMEPYPLALLMRAMDAASLMLGDTLHKGAFGREASKEVGDEGGAP